jgi:SAM-dependent methyltransferase
MEQGRSFDRVAELYDRVRPGYPDAVLDDIAAIAGLSPGDAVLEIGCGTGKATEGSVRRGLAVVGLDPGGAMRRVAAERVSGLGHVELCESTFEAWPLACGAFALVVAAQSFHWLEPEVRFAKTDRSASRRRMADGVRERAGVSRAGRLGCAAAFVSEAFAAVDGARAIRASGRARSYAGALRARAAARARDDAAAARSRSRTPRRATPRSSGLSRRTRSWSRAHASPCWPTSRLPSMPRADTYAVRYATCLTMARTRDAS